MTFNISPLLDFVGFVLKGAMLASASTGDGRLTKTGYLPGGKRVVLRIASGCTRGLADSA